MSVVSLARFRPLAGDGFVSLERRDATRANAFAYAHNAGQAVRVCGCVFVCRRVN